MHCTTISPSKGVLLSFAFFLLTASCSKDVDLLASYVVQDGESSLNNYSEYLINDSYNLNGNSSIVLDVLDNDTFIDTDKVQIVETSQPKNGTVQINPDNTLTYIITSGNNNEEVNTEESNENETTQENNTDITEEESAQTESTIQEPETAEEETETITFDDKTNEEEDTFTYTVKTTDEKGEIKTEEGKVTIFFNKKYENLKAFPSAEGFGKFATGGRGGKIIEVTNLNDSGNGSLRAALLAEGPRTIIFKVSGTIECNSYLQISNGNGNVTIAGQTAPGDGIAIKGAEFRIMASNVIVRHIRIRPGEQTTGSNEDALRIIAFNNTTTENVIIDHCSLSWGKDEIVEMGGIGGTSNVRNITIQNSIVGENISTSHKFGLILWNRANNISVYKNLFVHNMERNIRSSTCTSSFEMINNLVYGFKDATYPTYENQFDIIGNVYKSNPNVSVNETVIQLTASLNNCPDGNISGTQGYIHDNTLDGNSAKISSNINPYLQNTPVFNSGINPMQSSEVESTVLANVGASKPNRDSSDERVVQNVINRNGGMLINVSDVGYPNLKSGEAYQDSDKDGMDDEWETSVGLDPTDSTDGKKDVNNDGYTNLEIFLEYLAQE
ncbi:Ig-like domain-containing protein [Zobellia nedashkovskayae]|uniref:Ig-like domain-containing protein n=1 Tax=Zobellia nedashkovskayae TaxID=2779510 RepID=UPI00188B1F91|nr:Ig-like domain-containing protein [Zobellia nedashkovskayae]